MKLTKTSETYILTSKGTEPNKQLFINISVDNGRITLTNQYDDQEFIFENSKPEMLIKIGQMISTIGRKFNGTR